MITTEQIDKEIDRLMSRQDVMEKDIINKDSIDRSLSDMGTFYKKITEKLSQDALCFMCKKPLEKLEEFDIIEVPHKKMDKGLVAFAAICKKCTHNEV